MTVETDVKNLKKMIITLDKQVKQLTKQVNDQDRTIKEAYKLAKTNSTRLDNSRNQINEVLRDAGRAYDKNLKNMRALDKRLRALER